MDFMPMGQLHVASALPTPSARLPPFLAAKVATWMDQDILYCQPLASEFYPPLTKHTL